MKRFTVAVGFYDKRHCEREKSRQAIKCGIHTVWLRYLTYGG